jgi:hypothetical protein
MEKSPARTKPSGAVSLGGGAQNREERYVGVRHNPRDKAARLPSGTDAGYQALLLGRRVGPGNSPAGVDLTGMANPNVPRENPDAPLT